MQSLYRRRAEQLVENSANTKLNYHSIISSSEAPAILNINPYETYDELLKRKCRNDEYEDIGMSAFNRRYRDTVLDYYISTQTNSQHIVRGVKCQHTGYSYLGTTLDAVDVTSGTIIKVVCPQHRKISCGIPIYYWVQMQFQMAVSGLNKCRFIEYKVREFDDRSVFVRAKREVKWVAEGQLNGGVGGWWLITQSHIRECESDGNWFKGVQSTFVKFWRKVQEYRKRGLGALMDAYPTNTPRRSKRLGARSPPSAPTPKRRKLSSPTTGIISIDGVGVGERLKYQNKILSGEIEKGSINWKEWIAATRLRNYMLDDPLLDYLKMYGSRGRKKKRRSGGTTTRGKIKSAPSIVEILKRGNEFETGVMDHLYKRFPRSIQTICIDDRLVWQADPWCAE